MGTQQRVPPGRQPYDALHGLRLGAIVGSLLGALVALAVGWGMVGLIVATAAVGGFAGYHYERRQVERERARQRDRR